MAKRLTLASALEKATSADFDSFIHPKLRPEVRAREAAEAQMPPMQRSTEVYPFLGVSKHASASGVAPEGVVCGPSVPMSGSRDLSADNPFSGLSRDMADYASRRTAAIMVGSRAGC